MFHWFHRWLYLRRSRRRSLKLSEERYPRRQAEPGNIFNYASIQDADDQRSSRTKTIRRRVLITVVIIACLASLWFIVETIGAIGIFSG